MLRVLKKIMLGPVTYFKRTQKIEYPKGHVLKNSVLLSQNESQDGASKKFEFEKINLSSSQKKSMFKNEVEKTEKEINKVRAKYIS